MLSRGQKPVNELPPVKRIFMAIVAAETDPLQGWEEPRPIVVIKRNPD